MQTTTHSREVSLRNRISAVTTTDTLECRICGSEKSKAQFYAKAGPGKWGYHVCRDCTHQAYLDAKDLARDLLEARDKRQIICRMCKAEKGLPEYYVSAIASHLQDFPVICKACSKSLARQSAADKRAKEKEETVRGIGIKDLLGE